MLGKGFRTAGLPGYSQVGGDDCREDRAQLLEEGGEQEQTAKQDDQLETEDNVSVGDEPKMEPLGRISSANDLSCEEMRCAEVEANEHRRGIDMKGASVFACALNLANSLMGAGILGLPYAIQNTGLAAGPTTFVFVGIISAFTMYLLINGAATTGVATYEQLVEKCFGAIGKKSLEVVMICSIVGVLTAYTVLLADFLSPLVCPWTGHLSKAGLGFVADRRVIMAMLVLCVIYPLCCVENLSSLRFVSSTSMGLMAAFVMVLIYRMHVPFAGSTLVDTTPSMESRPRGTVSLESFLTNLSGVPIITFAFSCHVCIFPIYNTLEQPTVGRMSMVILLAVSMCMCLYGMVSIVGQFVFGDQICPNLLNNFRVDDPLLGAMRVAFAISIAAGYPFALFAARRSLDMLVFPKASLQGMSTLRFRTEALALALVALMLAALVPGVRVVFAFTGSMFATTLAFIVPALCYLRLAESLDCMAYLSIVVFIVGVALGTFSTLANVMTIIAGDPTPKGCLSAGACTITHP